LDDFFENIDVINVRFVLLCVAVAVAVLFS